MRVLAALAVIAALSAPALAQEDAAGSNKHHRAPKKSTETPKATANEQDYKSALDRLPQQKYDPWGTARKTSDTPGDKH